MKSIWKKLLIVPLILAVAMGPGWAQTDAQTGAPPTPPVPPAPNSETATNVDQAVKNAQDSEARAKKSSDGTHMPVHMNNTRVGFGGPYGPEGPNVLEIVALVAVLATALVLPVTLLCVFLHFRHRRTKLLHETLRAMVDKGVPIPPELLNTKTQSTPRQRGNDLRRGLMCVGVGLGLVLMALATHGSGKIGFAGFIPLFIGAAFLIAWRVEQPRQDQPEN
jgi:hypothetical protein